MIQKMKKALLQIRMGGVEATLGDRLDSIISGISALVESLEITRLLHQASEESENNILEYEALKKHHAALIHAMISGALSSLPGLVAHLRTTGAPDIGASVETLRVAAFEEGAALGDISLQLRGIASHMEDEQFEESDKAALTVDATALENVLAASKMSDKECISLKAAETECNVLIKKLLLEREASGLASDVAVLRASLFSLSSHLELATTSALSSLSRLERAQFTVEAAMLDGILKHVSRASHHRAEAQGAKALLLSRGAARGAEGALLT